MPDLVYMGLVKKRNAGPEQGLTYIDMGHDNYPDTWGGAMILAEDKAVKVAMIAFNQEIQDFKYHLREPGVR